MKSVLPRLLFALFALFLTGATVRAQATPELRTVPLTVEVSDASALVAGDGDYLVQLVSQPAARYRGGVAGLAATSREVSGAAKFDAAAPATVAYVDYLQTRHQALQSRIEGLLGRKLQVAFEYYYAVNGFALTLSADEVAQIAALAEVESVTPIIDQELHTDAGPTWIGAPQIWDGSATGVSSKGEGIVIGIIDSGINMDHPSFADIGGDGYNHSNPLGSGTYRGWCDSSHPNFDPSLPCNDKLIGAYDFIGSTPNDVNGHGSHVGSTAGGNALNATLDAPTASISADISGVAPHANIIIYGVEGNDGSCCNGAALLAAIDQATQDGVDVVNYSIGGGDYSPWTPGQTPLAFLSMFEAGIIVATSAGNDGPGSSSLGSPGNAPWMMTVGATTHNRKIVNSVTDLNSDGPSLADIEGASFTAGYGPATIIYAGDVASGSTATPELCAAGAPQSFTSPWPPGTFSGEIVVCDRGEYGRVEKGNNVLAAGAGGMILVDDGGGVVSDPHDLPAVHISQADGAVLKGWLAANSNTTGTISGYTLDISPANGDIMAGFSSRGPQNQGEVIKPSITAPGVSIMAAYADDGTPGTDEYNFLGGTSMASPHAAGSAALVRAVNPTWTAHEVYSALMMTAEQMVVDVDLSQATPFEMGNGRINVERAAQSGLLMDETTANFEAADPGLGGDPKTLNIPSMQDSDCTFSCGWTRTFRSSESSRLSTTWDVSVSMSDAGVVANVSQSQVVVAPGASFSLDVDIDVSQAAVGVWHFGELRLSDAGGNYPDAHLPIAVLTPASSAPSIFRKSATPIVGIGDTIDYVVTVSNTNAANTSFVISDTLPAGVTLLPASVNSSKGTPVVNGDNVMWNVDIDGGAVSLSQQFVPFGGYVSLAGLGVAPFGCPTDCDDGGFNLVGLDITYLGRHYRSATLSVNGVLQLGDAGDLAPGANTSLPDPALPNNILAPLWTDLDMTSSGEWYVAGLTNGTDNWIVFEWENVKRKGDPSSNFTFQIWLTEGTDEIFYTYNALVPGSGTDITIGAEDSAGAGGATFYYNGAGTVPTTGPHFRVNVVTSGGDSEQLTFSASADQAGQVINIADLTVNSRAAAERALASTTVTAPTSVGLGLATVTPAGVTLLIAIFVLALSGAAMIVIARRR